jgi:hypothetical protein
MKLKRLFLPLLFSLSAVVASAIEVPFSYTFTASGFTDEVTGLPGPISTISGSVSGSFTPGLFFTTVTLSSINLSIDGFNYTLANTGGTVEEGLLLPGGGHSGSFLIGGLVSGTHGISQGTDDFWVSIDDHLGNGFGHGSGMAYSTASDAAIFHTFDLRFSSLPSGVPDSGSSVALLACGISLTTFIKFRRRQFHGVRA